MASRLSRLFPWSTTPKDLAGAIRTAGKRVRDARTIGWKELEASWQATLNDLVKRQGKK